VKPRQTTLWQYLWYTLYIVGVAVIVLLWWRATGHTTTPAKASAEMAAGNLTGLVGTYAILWQLVLLGRLTFLENTFGLEKLTWLHKWNGYLALIFILLHGLFLIWGYGAFAHAGFIKQLLDFMANWDDVLKATLGTIILIVAVCMSIGIVRRGFKYETWYFVHLFIYLAILLAFSHQLSVGSDLAGNRPFQLFWYLLYALSVGSLLAWRFGRPLWLFYYHQLKVEKIVRETPSIVSIYVTGRHLNQLHYQPGQFMIWRFLTKDLWWQAHPFSLSTAPNGNYLRCTVKQVGDFTRQLPALKPGTPVLLDGPHGHFTAAHLTGPRLLLIAGGSGITPLRALLEQLPAAATDVVLIYAARTAADLALRPEIESLAARHHVTVHYILSAAQAPGMAHGLLNAAHIKQFVPDAASREVMLCAPPAMMDAITAALHHLGVPRHAVHTERFAY